jgi:hypothetical protein
MQALSTGQILREPVATATWMTSRSNLGLGPQQFMFGGVTLLPACHLLGCRMNKKCPTLSQSEEHSSGGISWARRWRCCSDEGAW